MWRLIFSFHKAGGWWWGRGVGLVNTIRLTIDRTAHGMNEEASYAEQVSEQTQAKKKVTFTGAFDFLSPGSVVSVRRHFYCSN